MASCNAVPASQDSRRRVEGLVCCQRVLSTKEGMMRTRILSFVLLGVCILTVSKAFGDDHGNSPTNSPTSLPVGAILAGVLETSEDVDCFATEVQPGKWYGWALFGDPHMRPFDLYNAQADFGGGSRGDFFNTLIWQQWDWGDYDPSAEAEYFYPAVAFSDWYSGDENAYRVAAVRFPDTASPVGTLITFSLSEANPVDTRLFTFAEGSGPKVVCMSLLDQLGGDADPQLVGWTEHTGFALSANTTARHITIFGGDDDVMELRTLVHNPGWDNMSPGGDMIGLRVHGYNPVALSNGVGAGIISAPCQADLWTVDLEEGQRYAAWLTRPDGSLAGWGDYEIAPFYVMEGGRYWSEYQPSIQGMLDFEAYFAGQHVFAILSNEAKVEGYTLHLQESTGDDYGSWQGDTPDVGTVALNATTSGIIELPPDEDVFIFQAEAGKTYALYSEVENDFDLAMSGDWNWPEYLYGNLFTAPEEGTCRVTVRYQNTLGAYEFMVSEFSDDADNTREDAIRLSVGGPESANDLKAPGDKDWFVFHAESGKAYAFTTGNAGHTLLLYGAMDWPSRSMLGPQVTINADYTGDYYIVVRAAPSNGVYNVMVTLQGATPEGYDLWAADYDLGDTGGPDDDADGDGFTNEQERIAGTNPTLEGDLFRASTATFTSSGAGLILGDAVPGRKYTVRHSSDLSLNMSLWSLTPTSIVDGKIVAAIDPGDLSAYYRLYVELE